MKNLIFFIFLFFSSAKSIAQDVHWSQVNENSMYQNPANTGLFSGDFRVSLSTKDQWRNVTKPYQTQAITFDAVNKYNRKLTYGGLIIHDVTGDGIFRTLEMKFTPAYTIYQNLQKKTKIRIGLEIGWKYNQMNFSNYMFDNQFNGYTYSELIPSKEKNSTQQKSNITLGIGSNYSKEISDVVTLNLGSAVFNINQPDQGFYNIKVPRFTRYHHFVQLVYKISPIINLLPMLNIQHQGVYNELVIGSKCELKTSIFSLKNQLISGLYFRNKDALFLQLGLKINQIISTINYDINVSKLYKASNGRGGLEINIQYIWSRKTEKNIMHKKCIDYL